MLSGVATVAGLLPFGKTIVGKGLKALSNRGGDEVVENVVKRADDVGGSSAKNTAENAAAQVDDAAKRGPIEWVNEGHGNPAAAAYEAGAAGHVPGKAPRLSATDAEGTVTAKFDGVDGGTMVDRKLSVTTFPKSERQMLRQSATAAENGYGVRWEVPTAAEQARAQKMAESLGVKNIDVQVK